MPEKIPLFPPFIKGDIRGISLYPEPCTLYPDPCLHFTNIGGTLAGNTSILRHTSPTT